MKITIFNLVLYTLNDKVIMAEAVMYLFIENLEKLQIKISLPLGLKNLDILSGNQVQGEKKMNSPIFLSLSSRKHFLL